MTTPTPARKRGRPPLAAGEPTERFELRMTASQLEKLRRLGGAAWVRSIIDKAKEPKP